MIGDMIMINCSIIFGMGFCRVDLEKVDTYNPLMRVFQGTKDAYLMNCFGGQNDALKIGDQLLNPHLFVASIIFFSAFTLKFVMVSMDVEHHTHLNVFWLNGRPIRFP